MIYKGKHYCSKCDHVTDIEIDIDDLPDEFNQPFRTSEINCSKCNKGIDVIFQCDVWTETR